MKIFRSLEKKVATKKMAQLYRNKNHYLLEIKQAF